jgi:hypothetical protein
MHYTHDVSHHHYSYTNITPHHLLKTIQHCEETCEGMVSMLVNKVDRSHSREKQIQLLRDCADICTLMAKYLARNSQLSKSLAQYCAYVCEVCGNTCLQFPDHESQQCGQICLNCAQECKSYSV